MGEQSILIYAIIFIREQMTSVVIAIWILPYS